ncbi:MAG: DNA helicase-2/ATP-dependent DNA helicase PcrA [Rhodothermales bacterium]|jgi:DNA helicase-2/ATP-dependent DNA helicase PcrA
MNLSTVNPQQRDAIKHIKGSLLVLAGAGTGKTTVITYRIGYMLEQGVEPEAILAVTFTNKAASEMRQRVKALLPEVDHNALTICTFHSFCCAVLRRYIHKLGFPRRFGIADEGDQNDLIRQCMSELGLLKGDLEHRFFKNGISDAKNVLHTAEDIREMGKMEWFETLATVYSLYNQKLREMGLVDFDDLLMLTVRLLNEQDEIRKKFQERYRNILVDEFQDTNHAQYELIRVLAGRTRNVCVVGDDDQSIYGWRGADVSNILDFPTNFPGAKVVKLEQNYRSTNNILQAANAVIGNNDMRHDKALWSAAGEGEKLRLFERLNEGDEADLVGRLFGELAHRLDVSYDQMAILYRSNAQSRSFEIALRKRGLPYRVVGSRSFFERREIKDAIAYLRIIDNERDDLSLLRVINVPPRGIGAKTLDRLRVQREHSSMGMQQIIQDEEFLSSIPPKAAESIRSFNRELRKARTAFSLPGQLSQHAVDYLKDIGYIPGLPRMYKDRDEYLMRYENVQEFLHAVHEYENKVDEPPFLIDFMQANALLDMNDRVDDKDQEEGITLMTVHASKGLEFDAVCVVGMDQKLFPHGRSIDDHNLDEERRLFYVAVTRAKKYLALTRARKRTRLDHGRMRELRTLPSMFLAELPEELVILNDESLFAPADQGSVESAIANLMARWQD